MPDRSALLHVAPGRHGDWVVSDDKTPEPLSAHRDATAALRAATARAERAGGGEVLVHDRYHHVRPHRCAASTRSA
jgi:hypothetical protein